MLSLGVIYVAGLLSVLSPCVLPMLPIIVSGLAGSTDGSRWTRLRATSWFALGFGAVFIAIGLGMPFIVMVAGPLRPGLLLGSAVIVVLYGLRMSGLLRRVPGVEWMNRSVGVASLPKPSSRRLQNLFFGVAFALSWTPCAGPVLGGVLTYTASDDALLVVSGWMLLIYAAGVATPLLLVALAAEHVVPAIRRMGPYLQRLELATGAGLVVAGLLVMTGETRLVTNALSPDAVTPLVTVGPDDLLQPSPVQRLVFFHSEHCPNCRAMSEMLPDLVRRCRSDLWQMVSVDVDQPRNAAVVEHFAVRAVPTVSLLDGQGRERAHLVGYQSPAELRELLEHKATVACSGADEGAPLDVPQGSACAVGEAC